MKQGKVTVSNKFSRSSLIGVSSNYTLKKTGILTYLNLQSYLDDSSNFQFQTLPANTNYVKDTVISALILKSHFISSNSLHKATTCLGFDQDSPSLQTALVLVIFFCRKGRKCKVLPRIGHEDPVGQLRYSFHISLTLTLDSGRQSMSRSGRFTPGKETQYSPYRRLGGLWDWF